VRPVARKAEPARTAGAARAVPVKALRAVPKKKIKAAPQLPRRRPGGELTGLASAELSLQR
jgi:hypothetical protein